MHIYSEQVEVNDYVRNQQLLSVVDDLFAHHDDRQLLGQLYQTSTILTLYNTSHDRHMMIILLI